jgi:hypothetical protein
MGTCDGRGKLWQQDRYDDGSYARSISEWPCPGCTACAPVGTKAPAIMGGWWLYGDYTGDACPNCSRLRLMACVDSAGVERVICEKCAWEPARDDYCHEAVGS